MPTKTLQPKKSSIAKRLFEDEDEIEYGDSGGSVDNEESDKGEQLNPIIERVENSAPRLDEQKSVDQDKLKLEVSASSQEVLEPSEK